MTLGEALDRLNCTTLRFSRAAPHLQLRRDFDAGLDFGRYGHGFQIDHVTANEPLRLGEAESRSALQAAESLADAELLLAAMSAAEHELVVLHRHRALNIGLFTCIHSSTLGANNGWHAKRAGGLRRHDIGTPERDVWQDGLNLSRAMTFKNAACDLPFGGCKLVAHMPPLPETFGAVRAELGFLAYCIDSGNLLTGPDMGFPASMIDELRAHFTRHIMCGPGGELGHTGAPTALGVFHALTAAARHRFGDRGVEGRRVAVQGLGAVGSTLCELLHGAGASLVVADVQAARAARVAERFGAEVVSPGSILATPVDILSPCAVGGVLSEPSIAAVRCAVICGAANNQLRADDEAGEIALARMLAERDVLLVPDWTATGGGVLLGCEVYQNPGHADRERVDKRIESAIGEATARRLAEAAASGMTPTEQAYREIRRRLDAAA